MCSSHGSLDFIQVVRLCQDNGLYGAFIYLFNKGLDDFRTQLSLKVAILVLIFPINGLLPQGEALRNHIVGGATGFGINSDLQGWSNSTTFVVNDFLVFNMVENQTVVEVPESDYENCVAKDPIDIEGFEDNSAQAMIELTETGWHYFISGTPSLCRIGLKVKGFCS